MANWDMKNLSNQTFTTHVHNTGNEKKEHLRFQVITESLSPDTICADC